MPDGAKAPKFTTKIPRCTKDSLYKISDMAKESIHSNRVIFLRATGSIIVKMDQAQSSTLMVICSVGPGSTIS